MDLRFFLILGGVLTFLVGCNNNTQKNEDKTEVVHNTVADSVNVVADKKELPAVVKEKDEEIFSSKINPIVVRLLRNTPLVKVPVRFSPDYSYRLRKDDDVKPLSTKMLEFLDFDRVCDIDNSGSSQVTLRARLYLSDNFITLILQREDGGSGENYLVNYTNDMMFINSVEITYDDFAEGFSYEYSWINKNTVVVYLSSGTEECNSSKDTTFFKVDGYGKIDTLFVKERISEEILEDASKYKGLHESIKTFKRLENIITTKSFIIRIDQLNDGTYRYASWSLNQKMSEKPSLILTNGNYNRDGTGGNHYYDFHNGVHLYRCYLSPLRSSAASPAYLQVFKNDKEILYHAADVVK
ncbi:hypothetical protein OAT16_09470 [Prolixibacteraceae bacterium]|nr:hypothetical protein [Prolixibacteraceae bacterium]